jgi:hypothetical protein
MIQTLIQSSKFNGKYVALKDFKDHTVIAEGTTPKEVQDSAFQKGYKDPVITFVPAKNMVQIY